MNNFLVLLSFILLLSPSVSHSKYQRPIQVSAAGQNYIAVDEVIWKHARPDLGDLRLLSGDSEIPYAISVQRGSLEEDRKDLTVFQQATVQGKTQFLIDMSGLAEYDHVQLKLATKNFVAHARVEGQDDPHAKTWAGLGSTIIYDLSRENLGSNTTLRIPRSTYKYLRITVDGPVQPSDVQGAVSKMAEEQPAVWRDVASLNAPAQSGKDTVFTFSLPETVPVERVSFSIAPSAQNFRRDVEIRDEKDGWLGSGEIERVHMVRAGQKIDSEQQSVAFSANGHTTVKVIVHNGDDRPLDISGARLQQLERRIYFDASAPARLLIYYGDEKLNSPVYDYAKLFQQSKNAVAAQLGAETLNAAFTQRPDERPWSERHQFVLWIAIVLAVLGLGAVAIRSMRTATA
ncbi:MAG TPA: DUF3999 family protein [Terriglobales bacterium]|nr:DUF3999 family protein [Terriglobales bacterium]